MKKKKIKRWGKNRRNPNIQMIEAPKNNRKGKVENQNRQRIWENFLKCKEPWVSRLKGHTTPRTQDKNHPTSWYISMKFRTLRIKTRSYKLLKRLRKQKSHTIRTISDMQSLKKKFTSHTSILWKLLECVKYALKGGSKPSKRGTDDPMQERHKGNLQNDEG